MWIEDLHWADGEVVQLLDRLTLGAEMPLLVVATARPELAAQGGLRPGGDRFFLTLDALDDGGPGRSPDTRAAPDAQGVERAEGNPLYVIELARARSLGIARDVPLDAQRGHRRPSGGAGGAGSRAAPVRRGRRRDVRGP